MSGKTNKPESIRPGSRTFCSTCESAVSQEVLAPFGVARSLSFLNRVDSAGRARGLSGAPDGARGRRPVSEDLHRLDPDGWLVQSSTDTNSIESPAEQRRTKGANGKCAVPQTRGHRPSFPDSVCLLDKRLLMGGADEVNKVKKVSPGTNWKQNLPRRLPYLLNIERGRYDRATRQYC